MWENVDLDARTLTIPRTKNGDSITLPLNPDALRAMLIFRSRGDGKGRVVRNAVGETLNVNAHWFVKAVRDSKIKHFRWHDCRHTFASSCVKPEHHWGTLLNYSVTKDSRWPSGTHIFRFPTWMKQLREFQLTPENSRTSRCLPISTNFFVVMVF